MITGHCTYLLKEGCREDFIRDLKASGFLEKARKENGNIAYIPYSSIEDPNIVMVVERWDAASNIKEHEKQPHIADLNKVCEKYLISLTLEYFESDGFVDQRTLTIEEMMNGPA